MVASNAVHKIGLKRNRAFRSRTVSRQPASHERVQDLRSRLARGFEARRKTRSARSRRSARSWPARAPTTPRSNPPPRAIEPLGCLVESARLDRLVRDQRRPGAQERHAEEVGKLLGIARGIDAQKRRRGNHQKRQKRRCPEHRGSQLGQAHPAARARRRLRRRGWRPRRLGGRRPHAHNLPAEPRRWPLRPR